MSYKNTTSAIRKNRGVGDQRVRTMEADLDDTMTKLASLEDAFEEYTPMRVVTSLPSTLEEDVIYAVVEDE